MRNPSNNRSRLGLAVFGTYAVVVVSLLASTAAPIPALSTIANSMREGLSGQVAAAASLDITATPNQPQTPEQAFAAMQARAAGPLTARWNADTGTPEFLTTQNAQQRIPYIPTAAERGKPAAIALGFFDANRALFKINSAAQELQLIRLESDKQLGYSHVRMGQMYKGFPVFGKQMMLHLDAKEQVTAVNGHFIPGIDADTTVTFKKEDAVALAKEDLLKNVLTPEEAKRATVQDLPQHTQLMIYVDDAGHSTLTWYIKFLTMSPRGEWQFFVSARRPRVVHHIEFSHSLKRRVTFTARNGTDIPGRKLADEGERTNDPIGQAAHDGAGKVYDFYFKNFQRDGLDGQGSPMVSTVHYGSDPADAENAAWVQEAGQMIYGDGGQMFKPLAQGLDVIGHEFTHGVVGSTADLVYEGQSGALNESYADVFGVLISQSDWTVGRTVIKSPPFPVEYLRSLSDPNAEGNYDPSQPLGGVGQPANMNEYARLPVSRRYDNGGVHINSGVPNHVAYLISRELGNDKVAQIYYRALTNYLTQDSKFADAANATIQSARELYDQPTADVVQKAFAQVGIGTSGSNPAPNQPAPSTNPAKGKATPVEQPNVPAGCTNVIANGSFESDDAWKQLTKGSTGLLDKELPHSGARSSWLGGQDKESPQIIVQDIQIPANATTVSLSYYRLIHEEKKSGGIFSSFTDDAKFGAILVTPQGEAVATLEKTPSSSGNDRWEKQTHDISQLAGKKLRLLFASENPGGNISSFFVDDVALVACTGGNVASAPTTNSNDLVFLSGRIVNADTGRGIYGAQLYILNPGLSASDAAADDNINKNEVLTLAVTDQNGEYTTKEPVKRGQTLSVIVVAKGYKPIIADDGVQIASDAANPKVINAKMRQR